MTAFAPIVALAEFEAETLAAVTPQFVSHYGMLAWADLDRPGAETEWLIDDLLTVGNKSIIGGPSQSGKSFLAIEAGMCIALDKPFLGHPVQGGLVIYQAGEGALGIKNRLRAYRKHFDVPRDAQVPFVLLTSRVDLFSEDGDTPGLIAEVQAIRAMYPQPLRVLFIDTLSKAQGMASENDGRDMMCVLNHIDQIREATGVHICLVHHLNADGTKLRGHTSVFANVDEVIGVVRDKETKVRTVRTTKVRDGADDVEFKFELMSVPLGHNNRGKEITSCVVLPVGEKDMIKNEEMAKSWKPNAGEKTFMLALFKALDEVGEAPPPNVSEIPSSVRKVVDFKAFRKIFAAMALSADEDERKAQARIRQAVKRAGEYLRNAHVIGVHDPYVWWTGRVVHGVPQTYPPKRKEQKELQEGDDGLPF